MKITLNQVGSLIDATTAATTINNNSDTIETAFENTLSRDGTSPNQMGASLDMDSHQILNLPGPLTANSPLRLQDLEDFNGGGTVASIPQGGTTGQVLAKDSNVDFDIGWRNSVTSVGLNLPSDFTIIGSPVTTSGTLTGVWTNAPAGTGGVVRSVAPTINIPILTSPTMTSPVLGTIASGIATNLTGTAAGLTAGNVTTNANLTGPITSTGNATAVASQTGTGSTFVMNTSPTLVTPNLGVPSAAVLTNATGSATGLTAGSVLTNANLTGDVTSAGNATTIATVNSNVGSFGSATATPVITVNGKGQVTAASSNTITPAISSVSGLGTGIPAFLITPSSANFKTAVTDETGSGALVFATSPALVTPTGIVKGDVGLGNVDNTSDATKNSAVATLTNKTLTSPVINTPTGIVKGDVGLGNVDNTSDVNKWAATKTLTNTTYDTAGTGNSLSINGVAATANTGTGSVVRATSPTLVTPVLGAATATTINGVTIDNNAWPTYTPTLSSTGGSLATTGTTVTGTAGRYKQIGKTVICEVDCGTITNVGTATGTMFATLPLTSAAFPYTGSSVEFSLTGRSGSCVINGGAAPTLVNTKQADTTTFWTLNYHVVMTITYEIP